MEKQVTGHWKYMGDNKYKLTVNLGFKANGKRNRKFRTVECKNKTEAELELAKFKMEVATGEYITPNKMTFSQFVEDWKNKYAKKELSPNTYETYLGYMNLRIIPYFGHLQLDQINPMQILDFLNSLESDGSRGDEKEGGLSSATIQYHHRILKNIFNRAVDWKIIKENPMKGVKKPKVISKKGNVFTEEQVQQLMECLRPEKTKWKMIVTLAITTGMRRGEILALEWEHVDLDKGKIHVVQSLSYTKEKGHVFGDTKTKNSNRIISLTKSVTEQLKQYRRVKVKERLMIGDAWKDDRNLLFSTDNGEPMHPSSVTSWWRKRLIKYGLPHITFHELRHTSATLLINQGVHMKTISSRLGHSKIGITMDLYGHALESADEAAANVFDTILDNKPKTTKSNA